MLALIRTLNTLFGSKRLRLASERGFESIAFPLIGAGTGGGSTNDVLMIMRDEITECAFHGVVRIVRFQC